MTNRIVAIFGQKCQKNVPMATKLEGGGGCKALVVGPQKSFFAASLKCSGSDPIFSKGSDPVLFFFILTG